MVRCRSPCGLDQAAVAGTGVGAPRGVGEHAVLLPDRERTDRVLDGAPVRRDVARPKHPDELRPLSAETTRCFASETAWYHGPERRIERVTELHGDRKRLLLSDAKSMLAARVLHGALDLVQLLDEPESPLGLALLRGPLRRDEAYRALAPDSGTTTDDGPDVAKPVAGSARGRSICRSPMTSSMC